MIWFIRCLRLIFIHRLTTSWVDAEFILDLKFLSGRRVFVEEPYKRTVVYELSCRSKDGNDMFVYSHQRTIISTNLKQHCGGG